MIGPTIPSSFERARAHPLARAAAYFSPDYATARQRFRESAVGAGWRLDERPVESRGPSGEPLFIDAAISPAQDPRRILVVSSALHGVEGFFGSAVQLALLEQWRAAAPGVRCVLVHALNPFGFAWIRRTDEGNVDLNRNFLPAGEAYSGSPPDYAALDALLNPSGPPSAWDPFPFKMALALVRRGASGVRRAVAVGQYDFPRGLFFGGAGATPTRRLIESALAAWLTGSEQVVHLDLHTGLGRWAEPKLLIDYSLTASQRGGLVRWFGADGFHTPESSRIAYTARGGLGLWCVASGLARDYLFAYLEVGTKSGFQVLAGLRAENRAHQWGSPSDPALTRAKAGLKELFCPSNPRWRSRALERSLDAIHRAAEMAARIA